MIFRRSNECQDLSSIFISIVSIKRSHKQQVCCFNGEMMRLNELHTENQNVLLFFKSLFVRFDEHRGHSFWFFLSIFRLFFWWTFSLAMHKCVHKRRLFSRQQSFWYSIVLLQVKNNANLSNNENGKSYYGKLVFKVSSPLLLWNSERIPKEKSGNRKIKIRCKCKDESRNGFSFECFDNWKKVSFSA